MEMYQRAYDCADKAFLIWKKVRGDDYKYTKNAFILRDKILLMKNSQKKWATTKNDGDDKSANRIEKYSRWF